MYPQCGYISNFYPLSYPLGSLFKSRLVCADKDRTMADKLLYIPFDDTQIYPFCILKLVVETFEHSTQPYQKKVPKVVKPTNRKTLL